MTNKQKKLYAIIDCEMSSLFPSTGELLELYTEIVDKELNVVDSVYLRCKPNKNQSYYKVEPEAMVVNKIDLIKHHEAAKPYDVSKYSFIEFLNRNTNYGQTKLVFVGQNFKGDYDYILNKFDITKEEWEQWFSRSGIDTKYLAEFFKLAGHIDDSVKDSLSSLANHFGISDTDKAHNCIEDVRMTREVLRNFLRLVKS